MNIRTLTAADIPFGLRLTAQNHWNQLEADWRRQLDLEPAGGFVAERGGVPIGTACSCVFDDVAWINLVLVDKDQRGQGVGTALMRHVLQHLDAHGVPTIRLDATPLGQPVYEKLGFVGDFTLTRYEGELVPSAGSASGGSKQTLPLAPRAGEGIESMTRDDLPAIYQLDAAVTQTRRDKLLSHVFAETPATARKFVRNGALEGYCLVRPGAHAWQIGPLLGSGVVGQSLLADAASRFAGQRVYLDVPVDNAVAIAHAQALGLTPQRSFLRMSRGRRVREDLANLWCSFGPEKG